MDARVSVEEIEAAYERIKDVVCLTPLEWSVRLSKRAKCSVFVKHEQMQYSGAFKLRGVANHIRSLCSGSARGVVTASTGNHGISVAYCAKRLGVEAHVVLCENGLPKDKLEQIELYGAQCEVVPGWCLDAEKRARQMELENNLYYIPPYNSPITINGAGTCGLEICRQMGAQKIDAVFTVIGGGGLISGISCYVKSKFPDAKMFAVSSEKTTAMYSSLKAGKIVHVESQVSVAHGCGGNLEEDAITFKLCQQYLEEVILVTDHEIKAAMTLLAQTDHVICEPTAAVSLAGFLKRQEIFKSTDNVVVVTCGRNVDFATMMDIFNECK